MAVVWKERKKEGSERRIRWRKGKVKVSRERRKRRMIATSSCLVVISYALDFRGSDRAHALKRRDGAASGSSLGIGGRGGGGETVGTLQPIPNHVVSDPAARASYGDTVRGPPQHSPTHSRTPIVYPLLLLTLYTSSRLHHTPRTPSWTTLRS